MLGDAHVQVSYIIIIPSVINESLGRNPHFLYFSFLINMVYLLKNLRSTFSEKKYLRTHFSVYFSF